ncbi:iron-sulfur cluster assembly accessory protein [Pseudohongiella sp. SYSU M77423]|uniref:HesB/IscA family protein n=1 Tax=unclassified Pseudohongiella TaxID=2629611 RepID=UPI001F1D3EC5|nr:MULTISPECIES: iron-sulfur cluster assembly accessory protein [unclassified Pseudohongiella]MDH7943476.1 iron-sulfur cluster assembly accessory protein [Pseudohongiella sp. SYSU M77423]
MTVETFDPQAASTPVSVTPAAVAHFRRQLQKDTNARAVRLSVKESGCTGFMYVVDLVQEGQAEDLHQQLEDGLELLIDSGSLGVVKGTKIDLVTEGVNRQLRFQNPNVVDQCGCGESFSIAKD